jgi:hypothetical protein
MPTHPGLKLLSAAFDFTSPPPKGRIVTMAARAVMTKPLPGVAREFPALDPGAKVPGGRVHAVRLNDPKLLEIATWNTGEASDLRAYGTRSHAESQFYEFMRDKEFEKVEIEMSHSPCTGCCDILAGLLRGKKVQAELRWAKPYEWGIQATNRQSLSALLTAGWTLAAAASAIPSDAQGLPIVRL